MNHSFWGQKKTTKWQNNFFWLEICFHICKYPILIWSGLSSFISPFSYSNGMFSKKKKTLKKTQIRIKKKKRKSWIENGSKAGRQRWWQWKLIVTPKNFIHSFKEKLKTKNSEKNFENKKKIYQKNSQSFFLLFRNWRLNECECISSQKIQRTELI